MSFDYPNAASILDWGCAYAALILWASYYNYCIRRDAAHNRHLAAKIVSAWLARPTK